MRCQDCPSSIALSYHFTSEPNAKADLCQSCYNARCIDIRESQLETKGGGSEEALQAVKAIRVEFKMPMEKEGVKLEQK